MDLKIKEMNNRKYKQFLNTKGVFCQSVGFSQEPTELNPALFEFQKDCVLWSLKKGRNALFQDCGLGKTIQQLEWAKLIHQHTGENILILAPLAVSRQTVEEGKKFKISVNICRSENDIKPGINITNYEILHKFNPDKFIGIVLDESSILKSFSGKYRNYIIESFKNTPYRLACTATPAPNDYMELGNHSEFLGIMTRAEMLSTFFINDSGDTGKWRLKGHAEKEFWQWVCTWAVLIRQPSDLGYDDNGFILPKIHYHSQVIKIEETEEKGLGIIRQEAKTLFDRRQARRDSLQERVIAAADLANKDKETWLIWCDLNNESNALSKSIKGAVEVKGSDTGEHKTKSMMDFARGKIRVLVSKPKICGFGMNFQVCHNMIFVGLSDSYEAFYQAVRRCWRFGQDKEVYAYIITSEKEGSVVKNVKRKEKDAEKMASEMIKQMSPISSIEIKGSVRDCTPYKTKNNMELPQWL